MPIAITCPTCSASIKAPESMAGQTSKCPKCKDTIRVPAFTPAEDPEPEEPEKDIYHSPRYPANDADEPKPEVQPTQIPPPKAHMPYPPPRQPEGQLRALGKAVRFISWTGCLVAAGLIAMDYMVTLSLAREVNALQKASLAAGHCFWVITFYIAARSIDSITRP